MKETFICEKCEKVFNNENDCLEHEKYCGGQNVPIKAIILDSDYKISILEYPSALITHDGLIKFVKNAYQFEWVRLKQFNLDNVYKTDWGELIIYTTNFDGKYEIECIHRLIQSAKQKIEKTYNQLERALTTLNELDENIIITERLTDAQVAIQEEQLS